MYVSPANLSKYNNKNSYERNDFDKTPDGDK